MASFRIALLGLSCVTFSAFAQTAAVPVARSGAVAPASKSINVSYGGKVTAFSVKELLDLPQVTLKVHNVTKNVDETYSGPLLSAVLEKAGLKVQRETETILLHSSLVATGSYRYFVLYSLAEVQPSFSKGQIIVAVQKSDLPNTDGGLIELVNTLDVNPARWVHGVTDLSVMTLAPNKD